MKGVVDGARRPHPTACRIATKTATRERTKNPVLASQVSASIGLSPRDKRLTPRAVTLERRGRVRQSQPRPSKMNDSTFFHSVKFSLEFFYARIA